MQIMVLCACLHMIECMEWGPGTGAIQKIQHTTRSKFKFKTN
ncbi:hypothetical protein GLYMA_01G185351v4 [Glycine max]|nr:hypothetical protein GLYMA_01G185351v4 [Glycine max]KAH1163780.1 hypothetical protein GYH30_002011 [Glycine max]